METTSKTTAVFLEQDNLNKIQELVLVHLYRNSTLYMNEAIYYCKIIESSNSNSVVHGIAPQIKQRFPSALNTNPNYTVYAYHIVFCFIYILLYYKHQDEDYYTIYIYPDLFIYMRISGRIWYLKALDSLNALIKDEKDRKAKMDAILHKKKAIPTSIDTDNYIDTNEYETIIEDLKKRIKSLEQENERLKKELEKFKSNTPDEEEIDKATVFIKFIRTLFEKAAEKNWEKIEVKTSSNVTQYTYEIKTDRVNQLLDYLLSNQKLLVDKYIEKKASPTMEVVVCPFVGFLYSLNVFQNPQMLNKDLTDAFLFVYSDKNKTEDQNKATAKSCVRQIGGNNLEKFKENYKDLAKSIQDYSKRWKKHTK